ncbi:hypothetical protein LOAG_19041 [Loa loa]|uniref:C2H2-type domain-containing protein n=1 Tax=Loa loa TaxID=7209 RepID=A0A1S0UDN8_LOALO|nr:hypothetical protein LOAG_19041 [Loa loa]EJD73541.1 hypothetical protein LOAG_19041 [Loa loa]
MQKGCKGIRKKGIREYSYPRCTFHTNSQKDTEHKKTRGKPFIYECKEPNCGKKYNYSGSLANHRKRKHHLNINAETVTNPSPESTS